MIKGFLKKNCVTKEAVCTLPHTTMLCNLSPGTWVIITRFMVHTKGPDMPFCS